jgi:hypothetical protein
MTACPCRASSRIVRSTYRWLLKSDSRQLLRSFRGQERNLPPHVDHLRPELSADNVDSKATVLREDSPVGRSDGRIGSDAFTPAVAVGDAQIDWSGALERYMPPLTEMPQTVEITGSDGVVRSAKRSVRTDPEMRASHEHRRSVLQRAKAEDDQFSIRISSASGTSSNSRLGATLSATSAHVVEIFVPTIVSQNAIRRVRTVSRRRDRAARPNQPCWQQMHTGICGHRRRQGLLTVGRTNETNKTTRPTLLQSGAMSSIACQ